VLCDAPLALGTTFAGLGAMALALALREWPQKLMFVNLLTGVAAIGAAILMFAVFGEPSDPFGMTAAQDSLLTGMKGAYGLGSGADGGPALSWLVEAGIWGAGALALAGLVFVGRLLVSKDRRKAPSRGLALGLAALTAGLLAGPAGISAAGAATLAIMIGLAASYADPLRQSQRAAKAAKKASRQAEPDEALIDQSA
jgi:hypothetical protein